MIIAEATNLEDIVQDGIHSILFSWLVVSLLVFIIVKRIP
jgi:hypothetical protein